MISEKLTAGVKLEFNQTSRKKPEVNSGDSFNRESQMKKVRTYTIPPQHAM
jgi:hypothetical protein